MWRDSLALIQAAGVEDKTLERPKTLGNGWQIWWTRKSFPRSAIVPLDIFGLGSNRAKDRILASMSDFLCLLQYLGDDGLVASIRTALDLAENAARDLSRVYLEVWA